MIGRYRVQLNSVQLHSLDDKILILDVGYSPLEIQKRQSTVANLDGYEITDLYYDKRTVTVTFEIHAYDIAERNAICQKVMQWARGGGELKTNDREGQFLQVIAEELPDIASARNWTDPLTVVFVTAGCPFWQSRGDKKSAVASNGTSGRLALDGNAPYALVSVTATVSKSTLTSFTATVGSTTIELTGLSVPVGKTIVIDYTKDRYLRIRANGKSAMANMTATSNDNLQAVCGQQNKVSVTCSKGSAVMATFEARGLWL